jgi:DinB superfamily
MNSRELETLLERLAGSQSELSDLLSAMAGSQDWRPEPEVWSFRFLAAHLATAERECFQDRVQRITKGDYPSFAYYLNTGRDFSDLDLRKSLSTWHKTRQAIFRFVRRLPETAWLQTGKHVTSGTITIRDVLVSMLEHDQEHLEDLRLKVGKYEESLNHDGR